jgi:hypothetical protein
VRLALLGIIGLMLLVLFALWWMALGHLPAAPPRWYMIALVACVTAIVVGVGWGLWYGDN